MSIAVPLRSIERLVSFGGICGVVGVVCDLMEPVGSYTLWALVAGVLILLSGFVLATIRTWSDQVAQAVTAFGLLLATISIGFMAFAPAGDRGVLATEFAWVGDAQSELLNIKEVVLKIAEDTTQIADNTGQIAATSTQIADTSSQIATDTELVRHLSFSMDGFLTALASQDQINIRAYCDRGYRIYQTAYLFRQDRDSPQLSDINYSLLAELNCFDAVQLCDSSNWYGLGNSLDPHRVAEQCGTAGVQHMAQLEVDQKQREADAIRRREECKAEVLADPMYEFWPQIMMSRC